MSKSKPVISFCLTLTVLLLMGLPHQLTAKENDLFSESVLDKKVEESMGIKMIYAGCNLLTPELISNTFGVKQDILSKETSGEQGCRYKADHGENKEIDVLIEPKIHDSKADAVEEFHEFVGDLSETEAKKAMIDIGERAGKEGGSDKIKKKVTSMVSSSGISASPVEGLGDKAAIVNAPMNTMHLYVVYRNLLFKVNAYSGVRFRPWKQNHPSAVEGKGINESMSIFQKKTFDKRSAQAIKVAQKILEKVKNL